MPARWRIARLPRCTHHVFLSHCAEDRARLVLPLFERLQELQVIPWLDQHDYPLGRDPYEALREGIAKCRHVVYLITPSLLAQPRGWSVIEKAYAQILHSTLRDSDLELCHVELPLLFLADPSRAAKRTVWADVLQRASMCPPKSRRGARAIEWAARKIARFVRQEEVWAFDMGKEVEQDRSLRGRLERRGTIRRVKGLDPLPVTVTTPPARKMR